MFAPTGPERVPCGSFSGPDFFTAGDHTLGGFATWLSTQVGRPVLDKTGLNGRYDLQLRFAPQLPVDAAGRSNTSVAPSLVTALSEQLGLMLQAQRASIEMLVVDHVQPPSGN